MEAKGVLRAPKAIVESVPSDHWLFRPEVFRVATAVLESPSRPKDSYFKQFGRMVGRAGARGSEHSFGAAFTTVAVLRGL